MDFLESNQDFHLLFEGDDKIMGDSSSGVRILAEASDDDEEPVTMTGLWDA